MTPDDIALLERTVARLEPRGAVVAAEFYRRLFERVPEARTLFADDLAEQRRKFFATLTEIVGSLHDLSKVAEPTRSWAPATAPTGSGPSTTPSWARR